MGGFEREREREKLSSNYVGFHCWVLHVNVTGHMWCTFWCNPGKKKKKILRVVTSASVINAEQKHVPRSLLFGKPDPRLIWHDHESTHPLIIVQEDTIPRWSACKFYLLLGFPLPALPPCQQDLYLTVFNSGPGSGKKRRPNEISSALHLQICPVLLKWLSCFLVRLPLSTEKKRIKAVRAVLQRQPQQSP